MFVEAWSYAIFVSISLVDIAFRMVPSPMIEASATFPVVRYSLHVSLSRSFDAETLGHLGELGHMPFVIGLELGDLRPEVLVVQFGDGALISGDRVVLEDQRF